MFKKIVDSSDNYIYVVDPETCELHYMNKICRESFKTGEDYKGRHCYELLQGRSTPCEFCNSKELDFEGYYRWEYKNPVIGRHLMNADKLIAHDGRTFRLGVSVDITKHENSRQEYIEKHNVEENLIKCITLLNEERDMNRAIDKTLKMIGEFYSADRAYIFEITPDRTAVSNTYEWCKDGVSSEMHKLQNLALELMESWFVRFREEGELCLFSLEHELDSSASGYEILAAQGIDSLMATPLFDVNNEVTGFIGVDNMRAHVGNVSLLRKFAYFIRSEIDKRMLMNRLEELSFLDLLTGLENRNKYMVELSRLKASRPEKMGIVFLDLNGLKKANDVFGHDWGDKLLISLADMLGSCFAENIYRIGGDEFVVLCQHMEKEDFNKRVKALCDKAAAADNLASVGAAWDDGSPDIATLSREAERLMYVEKQKYHMKENI